MDHSTKQYRELWIFIPPWVSEGNYEIQFRAMAINNSYSFGSSFESSRGQSEANTTRPNSAPYMAYDTIGVEVSGRIAGLRVTDISDPIWRDHFFTDTGLHSGLIYSVGSNFLDGKSRSNGIYNRFPIGPGHHPQFKNLGTAKGYIFQFDLVTIGQMYGDDDKVRIKPTFYFVNKDGEYYKGSGAFGTVNERQAIDLYYHSGGEYLLRLEMKAGTSQT